MSTGTNRFAGKCGRCGAIVAAHTGVFEKTMGKTIVYHYACREAVEKPVETPIWQDDPKLPDWPVDTTPEAPDEKIDDALSIARSLLSLTKNASVNETQVRAIVAEMLADNKQIEYRDRIIVETNGEREELPDEPRHNVFATVLQALKCGLNVYLVGPAGCGKTHLGEQLAEALGTRFSFIGAMATKYDALGYNDAYGKFVANSDFPEWYENGGLFLFDEIDGSLPNALLPLNAPLANGCCHTAKGVIRKNKDFLCIAAANTWGNGATTKYIGRNPLDAASKDRWFYIPMDYDEQMERQLYGDTEWTAYVQKARKAVLDLKLEHVISMRAIAKGKELLEAGMDRETVELGALWSNLEPDQIAKVKKAM